MGGADGAGTKTEIIEINSSEAKCYLIKTDKQTSFFLELGLMIQYYKILFSFTYLDGLRFSDIRYYIQCRFDLGKFLLTFWSMGMKNLIHPGQWTCNSVEWYLELDGSFSAINFRIRGEICCDIFYWLGCPILHFYSNI